MTTSETSTVYYLLRILQRLALCGQVFLGVVYWIVAISITSGTTFAQQTVGHAWTNAPLLDRATQAALNHLSARFLLASVAVLVLTSLLWLVPQVRRTEKRLLLDSVVIGGFVALSVLFSHLLITQFVEGLLF